MSDSVIQSAKDLKAIMSDRSALKPFGINAKARGVMQPCQSLWLAHWMRTSYGPASLSNDPSTIGDDRKDGNSFSKQKMITSQITESSRKGTRIAIDIGQSNPLDHSHAMKGRKRMLEMPSDACQSGAQVVTRTTEIMKRSEMPTGSPIENFSPGVKATATDSLSLSNLCEPPFDGRNLACLYPKTDPTICSNDPQSGGKAGSVATVLDRSSKYLVQAENIIQNQQKEPDRDSEKENVLISRSFQEKIAGSTSTSVPYGVNTGAASTSCSFRKDQENIHTFHFKDNCQGFRAYLADMEIDTRLISPDSRGLNVHNMGGGSCFINLVKDDGRFHNSSVPMLLPSRNYNTCVSRLEESRYGQHESPQRMPAYCLQDLETLRISTIMDSMEQTTRGPPKFSKTTQHVLITKKTDVNVSHRGDDMVKNSTVHTDLKGNTFDGMLNQPAFFGCNMDQQKLQDVLDSSDREKEDRHAMRTRFVNRHNESSTETDTMFFDMYQLRNSFAGGTSPPSDKNVVAVASSGKAVEMGMLRIELPYPNDEFPTVSAVARSLGSKELSTSPTESLDVENFLSQIKQQPDNVNCYSQPEIPPTPSSCSRWVKRLRTSSSDSQPLGTYPWKAREELHGENINKLFTRIMSYRKTGLDPGLGNHLGKGTLENTGILPTIREASSGEPVKDHQDTNILSHFWIQRLRCKQEVAPETSRPPQVMCEPLSYDIALEECKKKQKKQLPSIAAMAMMGKAVVEPPCEFRKKGAFVVWST
ncbi:uncharacterized protein [Aristolochia californica]|uniref:uncharacterized protein n=1 Tax=Aristolochia californica TaxID=171875 RepID=UPI0035D5A0AA